MIRTDVPAEKYHERRIGVVSNSALKQVRISPAHYRAWVDGERGVQDSPALRFGRVLHVAILEPERFESEYIVAPDFGDLRKTANTDSVEAKANKTRKLEWGARNADANVVSAAWHRQITGMARSVAANRTANRIMRDGVAESTVEWIDSETGLQCKCRPDYYVDNLRLVADLKSCEDASPDGFARAAARYDYHVQDALYRDGMSASENGIEYFVFIAVEKDPPYACAVHALKQDSIGRGYRRARADITTLARCIAADEWPSYPDGINEIELPPWAA